MLAAGAAQAETPLSAIDWLSDSIAAPRDYGVAPSGVSQNALPEQISVSPLGGTTLDSVGLLPPEVTGLPADLWRRSASADIARRLKADRIDILPAMQDLLYTLLLAELDPPADAGPTPVLLLARIDTLLALGALERANALLERAGSTDPELFRRAFDISLLLRSENQTCAILRSTPALSPTFPARIFCLARGGDWDAAALTLETARALGFVTPSEDMLLARFLEPDLAHNALPLRLTTRPSPLTFRMLEAIGEPMPTAKLPRAFAQSDLQMNSGWKTQIEAAERLMRTGALDPNQLLGHYTESRPAASGGLWDRVRAVQALEAAIASGEVSRVETALLPAWTAMAAVELEVPFAQLYAEKLAAFPLHGDNEILAFQIGLLSDQYERFATEAGTRTEQKFLIDIALGRPGDRTQNDPYSAAIQEGFSRIGIPVRLQTLVNQGRLGEAILRAMELFSNGARGDLDELTDALMFLRSVGLERTARRASLQLLLLDRRG